MNTPINGCGMATAADVAELNKAINVDYSMPPTEGGSALRAYSIDGTLRSVTFTQKHIRFWQRIAKTRAYSTVEEYVKIKNYGNSRAGAFVQAGALPASQDSQYSRENKNVKYVGTTRAVTHQMATVETVVVDDIIAQEQINGTIYLLGVIEKALFDGDANIVAEEWDGAFTEINKEAASCKELIIDCGGANLTKYDLAKASNVILNNYGIPNLAYCDLETMAKINELFYNQQFITQTAGQGIIGGVTNTGFNYMPGQSWSYEPDVFLRPNEAPLAVKAGDDAPEAPASVAAVASTDKVAGSKFQTAIKCTYKVASINAKGESAAVAADASVQTVVGGSVTLTITPSTSGSVATGYKVFRADGNDETPLFIARIKAEAAPAVTTFTDLNEKIPGTGVLFLTYADPTNIVFKQLCPFVKIPLATIDASIRWMQLLYGTPICSTPRKNTIIKNINLN